MSSYCIDVGSVRSGLMICNRIISEHAEGLIYQTDTYRTYGGVLYWCNLTTIVFVVATYRSTAFHIFICFMLTRRAVMLICEWSYVYVVAKLKTWFVCWCYSLDTKIGCLTWSGLMTRLLSVVSMAKQSGSSQLPIMLYKETNTHLMASFPGQCGKASTRNVKPIWILMEQEMEWQSHQLHQMQIICTSLQIDKLASSSSLNFLQAGHSSDAQPTVLKHWRQFTYNLYMKE